MDSMHLECRPDGVYWVVVGVPAMVNPIFGKRFLRQCLKTRDLKLANELKGEFVSQFKRMIREAKAGMYRPQVPVPSHIKDALRFRRSQQPQNGAAMLEVAAELDRDAGGFAYLDPREELTPEAAEFLAVASGKETPITLHLPAFLASYKKEPRTVQAREHAIKGLAAWLRKEGMTPNIETVTRRVAARFRDHHAQQGKARDTINKELGGARLFWTWLMDEGHIPEGLNPWDRLSVTKSDGDSETVNAFTDEQIVAMFTHADAGRVYRRNGPRGAYWFEACSALSTNRRRLPRWGV